MRQPTHRMTLSSPSDQGVGGSLELSVLGVYISIQDA